MGKPRKGRGPRPGELGRDPLNKIIAVDNSDGLELGPQTPVKQGDFARAMVFAEFRYKHARALDYGGFIDRKPNQRPRL